MSSSDRNALKDLEANLKMVIFGQDEAIDSLAGVIKLSRAGLKDEGKPIGSFLFSGPTGVGKTEVCRQLAMIIRLIRFDMSEYMERHTVSRLIGAPLAMSVMIRVVSLRKLSQSSRTACYCSMKLKKLTLRSLIFYSKCSTTARLQITMAAKLTLEM